VKDAANSYVLDPIKDKVVGGAIETAGLGGAAQAYTNASNDMVSESKKLKKFQKFFNDTFK